MAGKVTDQLIEFIQARSEWGQQLYGQGMNPFDGRDSITDALEEVLDLAQYLMKWKQERDDIVRTLRWITEEWFYLNSNIIRTQLDGLLGKLSSDTAERHTKRP